MQAPITIKPYLMSAEDVLRSLATTVDRGLSGSEADARLGLHGPNELVEKGRKTAWRMLFAQVREVMVLILLAAVIISLFLQEYIDAGVIFVIVVLNTLLGFWQEYKAENAMAALKKMATPHVRVRRDGREQQISARELVQGDILFIEAGNIVPADSRLIEAVNLKAQEAALTGESQSVSKIVTPLQGDDPALADRKNMLYMGTVITYGRGQAVVTDTGMNTELGRIATLLQEVADERTPLQRRLARLGKTLALAAGLLVLAVVGLMLFRGMGLKETFMTAVSMAVAAIPEGLPAVVTISLALGAQQMLQKQALIRQLPAVETLGSVTVICSDKTGTLTQNRMTVTGMVLPDRRYTIEAAVAAVEDDPGLALLLLTGALCNDAVVDARTGNVLGDPTEGALVAAAQRAGLAQSELKTLLPRRHERPFDSDRKRMSTVHALPGPSKEGRLAQILGPAKVQGAADHIVLVKGAADGLTDVCDHLLVDGVVERLDEQRKTALLHENTALAKSGVRVLGLAYRWIDTDALAQPAHYETGLVFLGMATMLDPVRPEAVEAVHMCRQAGIRPMMITGDHPLTAMAIAKELGLSDSDVFVTGRELERMNPAERNECIATVSVFARVTPQHKMIIVDALQAQHQIVAMTGDGVNDAPALKSADIGVAMGITGTDVTKESSDMVLLDDNFATIVAAVREGRRIYDNIRKFVKYILTGNTGEILVMIVGPLLGMPLPLLPIQILWINLVTDGVPAIALGYEEAEQDVMQRPPYNPREGIFARGLGWQILAMGIVVGLISVGAGYAVWNGGSGSQGWQTVVFTMLTFCQMAYALCVRKQHTSLFRHSWFSNPALLAAIGVTLGLQLAIIYVPFLNTLFRTTPLGWAELGLCATGALAMVLVTEIRKAITVRQMRPNDA